jgi:short-subunit dehydrogenase
LPFLKEAGGGAIINVGSLAGRAPIPGSAVYAASKAGLRAFTYAIADEMPDSNIKFALVSPGPIDTGFIMADVDAVSDITFSQPISTADEVAQAVLDLCGNRQREQSMPALSGVLTTVMYLMPWLGKWVRPMLEKKGARVKRELKARQAASDSADAG